MQGTIRIGGTAVAVAMMAGLLLQQDRLAQVQARFDRETDPVRKAKLMPDLGDAEFQEVQRQIAAGNPAGALNWLEKYRDAAADCEKALDEKGIDAEKHPTGYKQLQISLRSSLRRIDDLVVSMTLDEQKPFLDLRKDIQELDHHVLHELFPRQPGTAGTSEKKKN